MMLSRDVLLHSLVRAGAREASRCGWSLAFQLIGRASLLLPRGLLRLKFVCSSLVMLQLQAAWIRGWI
jgi:hypothetical protein